MAIHCNVHPGRNTLLEELREHRHERRGTRPASPSPNQPHHRNPQPPAGNHRRHSPALGTLLRAPARVLKLERLQAASYELRHLPNRKPAGKSNPHSS